MHMLIRQKKNPRKPILLFHDANRRKTIRTIVPSLKKSLLPPSIQPWKTLLHGSFPFILLPNTWGRPYIWPTFRDGNPSTFTNSPWELKFSSTSVIRSLQCNYTRVSVVDGGGFIYLSYVWGEHSTVIIESWSPI